MNINFLSHNKDKKEETHKDFSGNDDKKEAIEWTDTSDVGLVSALADKKNDFKKNKNKNDKSAPPTNNRQKIDNMKKLKKSRKEILRLIDDEQKNSGVKEKKDISRKEEKKKLKVKKTKNQGGLSLWFSKLFNKKVDNKKNREIFSAKNSIISKEELLSGNKEKRVNKDSQDEDKIRHKKEIDNLRQTNRNKEWETPDILETNLIKDNVMVFFSWRKNIIFLVIAVIFSFVIVLGAYYWLIWQGVREVEDYGFGEKLTQINSQVEKAEKYIRDNRLEELRKKLNLANILLSNHVYWTNFFSYLEQNTLADVYYLNFFGNTKGKYVLNSKTEKFSIIESQVKQFLTDKYTVSAVVNRGVIDEKENTKDNEDYSNTNNISYDISLILDTSIFIDYE